MTQRIFKKKRIGKYGMVNGRMDRTLVSRAKVPEVKSRAIHNINLNELYTDIWGLKNSVPSEICKVHDSKLG